MEQLQSYEFWFLVGSQHLYGEETLRQVENNALEIVNELNKQANLSYKIVFKAVLTQSEDIQKIMFDANSNEHCAGVMTWMHTFSPAKTWISGLKALQKPLLHLHTQFNRDIPWDDIDMDFMNLNQSAHGDREFGFMTARMNIPRKVIAGHWQNTEVTSRISEWMKTAVAVTEGTNIRVARFGDNMRHVAVTDGDKIEAQIKFGWTVDYYGIGDLVEVMDGISAEAVQALYEAYGDLYELPAEAKHDGPVKDSIMEQARIELGLKKFLTERNYNAFTTNFEDLHGMKQLPGLAAQRLMAQGFGFAGEGDWRTAALLRMMKIISNNKGTSFMEDYTNHFEPGNEKALGSHMLEICPTIAQSKPKIAVSPLGIGGKSDPARLVFNGREGQAVIASLYEMGGRYRLLVNKIQAEKIEKDTPNLPVAKVLWTPEPSLTEATEAWIYAGGAHHNVFSYDVTVDQLDDFADMTGIECIVIDNDTEIRKFRKELNLSAARWD